MASDVRARLERVPRWVVVLVMILLSLLLLAALWPPDAETGAPVTVTRGDLVLTVDVEGELEAVRSREIGCPPVPEVEFKLAFMAPEGTEVKEGDPVLRFDTEALERLLAQKRAEYEEAATKVEQKTIDLEMKRLALEEQIAQAKAALGKAQLKAEVPPEVQQRIEYEKAVLEEKGCERDLENLRAEVRTTEALVGAELKSLVGQRDRARGRVEALERNIERMTVKAPQEGIVVYRTSWNDEKKKVGDSVWHGETLLGIPDLAEMKGDGFVDEADGGPVKEGQPVTVRLEARPDFDLEGRVARIGRTVQRRSWRTPLKGFKVEIALEKTDPTFMRPAMRFRGEIETGRVPGLLLVPRDAVFLRDDGPVVWAKRRLAWREVEVTLGRSNQKVIEVISGLSEGDTVSSVDLAASAPEASGAPGTSG
jgi:multidrug efflux pump subunit AcrA (membrane-fusion protein)